LFSLISTRHGDTRDYLEIAVPDDNVSPQLRNIEEAIDNFYLTNLLSSQSFPISGWYTMAIYEELAIRDILQQRGLNIHELAAKADNLLVTIQYPLRWLWSTCEKEGNPPIDLRSDLYKAAWEIQLLAHEYIQFDSAYTYASRGFIKLNIEGNTILPDKNMFTDSRYEAYNRFIEPQPYRPKPDNADITRIIAKGITTSENRFHFQIGKRIVNTTLDLLEPVFKELFELPSNWCFEKYSIEEFRKVSGVLLALSFIRYISRFIAALKGVKGLALLDSIIVIPIEKFEKQITRFSAISQRTVHNIISDLTFGSRGILKPDPALQPIIPLNNELVALMPNMIISSSLERNFISLLNRLPEERTRYLELVDEKEILLRKRLKAAKVNFQLRHYNGQIPGRQDLPDIDLAFISDDEESIILAEIKWFIGPSEPREVIEKGREIQFGIEQQKRIHQAIRNDDSLLAFLSIYPNYDYLHIVISQNDIGPDWAQDPLCPVIQADHFIKKISSVNSLKEMLVWCRDRQYLPIEGEDYKLVSTKSTIGHWNLEWYGLIPQLDGPLF